MSNMPISADKEQTPLATNRERSQRKFIPRVDILEDSHQVTIVADMPGVDENRIEIILQKDRLTIKGSAYLLEPEGLRKKYSEFPAREFERIFNVSDDLSRDEIEAAVKNGVLTIVLPKAASAKTRKITVQSRAS